MAEYWPHSFLRFFMAIVCSKRNWKQCLCKFLEENKEFLRKAYCMHRICAFIKSCRKNWLQLMDMMLTLQDSGEHDIKPCNSNKIIIFFQKDQSFAFLNFPYSVSKCFQICYPLKGLVSRFMQTNTFSESEKKKEIIFNIPLLFQEHRISLPLWRSLSMAFFYRAFKRAFLIIG